MSDQVNQVPVPFPCAGELVSHGECLEVRYPWDGSLAGTTRLADQPQLLRGVEAGTREFRPQIAHQDLDDLVR